MNLNGSPDAEGKVSIIANKTRNNYINLKGIYNEDVINCVHFFLCKYNVWNKKDNVISTIRPLTFVPDPKYYYDISFVLTFYNAACKSKAIKDVDGLPVKVDSNESSCENDPKYNNEANIIDLITQKQNELSDLIIRLIDENVEASDKNIELEKRMADIRLLINRIELNKIILMTYNNKINYK